MYEVTGNFCSEKTAISSAAIYSAERYGGLFGKSII